MPRASLTKLLRRDEMALYQATWWAWICCTRYGSIRDGMFSCDSRFLWMSNPKSWQSYRWLYLIRFLRWPLYNIMSLEEVDFVVCLCWALNGLEFGDILFYKRKLQHFVPSRLRRRGAVWIIWWQEGRHQGCNLVSDSPVREDVQDIAH